MKAVASNPPFMRHLAAIDLFFLTEVIMKLTKIDKVNATYFVYTK